MARVTLALFAACLLTACNSPKTMTGEVNFAAASEPGTLLVHAAGYGSTQQEALINAEQNAFNNLIFKGIPGSQYRLPMVGNDAGIRKTHEKYFQNLIDQKGYKAFMMSSEPGSFKARKGAKNLLATVKINVDALRRDMEQQNVLRKLGY